MTVLSYSTVNAIAAGILVYCFSMLLDWMMDYKNILFWIRLRIALKLERMFMLRVLVNLKYEDDPLNYMAAAYSAIVKKHWGFKLAICTICMSFWLLIPTAIYFKLNIMEFLIAYTAVFMTAKYIE